MTPFRSGSPRQILTRASSTHREAYPGDNGIRFVLREDGENVLRSYENSLRLKYEREADKREDGSAPALPEGPPSGIRRYDSGPLPPFIPYR